MDTSRGGFGHIKKATEEIQTMCDKVKEQVEAKTDQKYEVFTAVIYRSQVVNGTNYFIKVDVGDCLHIYLTIFQDFRGDVHLFNMHPDPMKPQEKVGQLCGGYTKPLDPTDEIHKICAETKHQVRTVKETNYEFFTAVKYRYQVVAGINYHIKVDVGDCLHIYLMIYQDFRGGLELADIQPDPILIV